MTPAPIFHVQLLDFLCWARVILICWEFADSMLGKWAVPVGVEESWNVDGGHRR